MAAEEIDKLINPDTAGSTVKFESIKLGLASPEKIRQWSYGEVVNSETINYRTGKPEPGGLFCERIFGPKKSYTCACGKYTNRERNKGIICDQCGVKVTDSAVRRERMGHIELAVPVAHIWYTKAMPNPICLLLDIRKAADLEKVLNYDAFIVKDPGMTGMKKGDVLDTLDKYEEMQEKYGADAFQAGMGAGIIREMLEELDLEEEAARTKELLANAKKQDKDKLVKKYDIIEALLTSGQRPEWMILEVLPVLPPDLRPMLQLQEGRSAASDLNDLYRKVIICNNNIRDMIERESPRPMLIGQMRQLQLLVDDLIDNGRRGKTKAVKSAKGSRQLKSLTESLKGKQGRFRQNLLGKRVDYSGRSVIVVGPELKFYQCGLPKEMAVELFKPFVIHELTMSGTAQNPQAARKMIESLDPRIWDVLEDVIKEHPVMLNRAPTLHRLSVQAFEPVLVEGRAIKLHPLACMAFNADFDGDQMAVHLPLSVEAQAECRFLMLAPNNLLKPADGGVVAIPSQDMVLGCYYLTNDRYREYENVPEDQIRKEYLLDDEHENIEAIRSDAESGKVNAYDKIRVRVEKKRYKDSDTRQEYVYYKNIVSTPEDMIGRKFLNLNRALLAFDNKEITLQQNIFVKRSAVMPDGTKVSGFVSTTLGKLLFNEIIPQDLGFVDRTDPKHVLEPEVNHLVKKGDLKKILNRCMVRHGSTVTAETLDNIKAMGYKWSTLSGISVSVSDMTVPANKPEILESAQKTVDEIGDLFGKGFLTNDERKKTVISQWQKADNTLKTALLGGLDKYNNIFMMADSGARGSDQQIKQLAGMRGLMQDTSGNTIELPIKSNLREGLDVLEYFISAHSARKGLSDTALRTADSGYLTRRMVDVCQDQIINMDDCAAGEEDIPGSYVTAFMEGKEVIEGFQERITGRTTAEEVRNAAGDVIAEKNELLTTDLAERVVKEGIEPASGTPFTDPETGEVRSDAKLKIRTVLTCKSQNGICAKCYGMNLAMGRQVRVGEVVGIMAAQSIGEPGTQLTMRNFHSGGVAGGTDITRGLPRVEELLEARRPAGMARIAEISGTVTITQEEPDKPKKIEIVSDDGQKDTHKDIPANATILVGDGDEVQKGQILTEGSLYPADVLRINGVEAVQDYILQQIQQVYRSQGVEINDKHVEVIVRQMMKRSVIEDPGDSSYVEGMLADTLAVQEANTYIQMAGGKPVKYQPTILGITKAAESSDSFISAASFQETTKALTDAAIKGKQDNLRGLKENVIIGRLIPAGTGMQEYNDLKLNTDEEPNTFLPDDSEEILNFDSEEDTEEDSDEIPEEDQAEDSTEDNASGDVPAEDAGDVPDPEQ